MESASTYQAVQAVGPSGSCQALAAPRIRAESALTSIATICQRFINKFLWSSLGVAPRSALQGDARQSIACRA